MKLNSAAALIAAASVSSEVVALAKRKERDVMLGINEDLCIFENYDDSWCF